LNASPTFHIGTCAWSYDDWRSVFYPEHLPAGDRLAFLARHFHTVEIDSTFYHAPAAHVSEHWAEVTPHDFLFSAKLPRELTHELRLHDCRPQLEAFLTSLAPLGRKLACVLVQLPPFFSPKHDEHALRDFIRQLPRDVRFAVEFRDAEWHQPRIMHLLAEHGVCWVWNDTSTLDHSAEAALGFWPHTTDFIYLRLLGDLDTKYHPDGSRVHLYREIRWPREAALENWAEKIRAVTPPATRVLVYASNQYEGFAPHSAARFAEKLGQAITLPTSDELTGRDTRQMKLL
jgi:uncharacterized protein YecE (DUF72 family)